MKMYEYHDIERFNVCRFVCDHIDEKLIVTKCNRDYVSFKIEKELTKAEYNMDVLNKLLVDEGAGIVEEEKVAIQYAIECIKTLDDMGIIKENKDND